MITPGSCFNAPSHRRSVYSNPFCRPLETREEIWGFCLPIEPAIFFPYKGNFAHFWESGELWSATLSYDPDEVFPHPETREVDIEFPVIMHVCHESRSYTLKHLPLLVGGAGHKTFYTGRRQYCPDLDVFHLRDAEDIARLMYMINGERQAAERKTSYCPLYRQINHIAVGVWSFAAGTYEEDDDLVDAFLAMPALRQVSLVIAERPSQWRNTRRVMRLAAYAGSGDIVHVERQSIPTEELSLENLEKIMDGMEDKLNLMEVDDQSPVDPESGELLIKFTASKMVEIA